MNRKFKPYPLTIASIILGAIVTLTPVGASAQSGVEQTSSVGEERIVIPVGSQSGMDSAEALPKKGLSASEVLARFGEPVERSAAKGEPPITRWSYSGFVVYFEGDTVIHSVVKFHPTGSTAEGQ